MNGQQEIQLYDIYPMWHLPFWKTWPFYIGVGVLISLIIGLLGWFVWKKLRNKKVATEPVWISALRNLRALQNKKCVTKEEGKQVYFALTDILKRYIQERFGLPVHGKTDEELIRYLKEHNLLPELRDDIADIAQGCVYIKFANEQAMQDHIARHIALSISLVTKTIPQESKK